jgi:hypothetical protein
VTCRTHDYERAIRSSGHILATALVIELDPVGMADATRYLTQGRPAFDRRWAPVVSRCQTVPAGPLASTFTMPLMVWLARVVYTEPATNPAELIDESRFNDRASLERHLIERFLPAVYPRRPRPRNARIGGQYSTTQTQHWLAYLARDLQRSQTADLAWWRMRESLSRTVRTVLGLFISALACGGFILLLRLVSGWGASTRQ